MGSTWAGIGQDDAKQVDWAKQVGKSQEHHLKECDFILGVLAEDFIYFIF